MPSFFLGLIRSLACFHPLLSFRSAKLIVDFFTFKVINKVTAQDIFFCYNSYASSFYVFTFKLWPANAVLALANRNPEGKETNLKRYHPSAFDYRIKFLLAYME